MIATKPIADGARIILGPGPSGWTEFCHSLPNARWNATACCWTCDFTPAAAWRILSRGECLHLRDDTHNPLVSAANSFGAHVHFAHNNLNSNIYIDQPLSKTSAWRHQLVGFAFARLQDATLLGMGMGTGKTKIACDLIVEWDCRTILILCPMSVRGVWKREIDRHAGRPIAVCIPTKGSTDCKAQVAADTLRIAAYSHAPTAVVVNYETAWRQPFGEWALSVDWDCVILDESHRVKSHNAAVSKYAAKLAKKARRRLCLTGTPLAQSPLDLFGQFRFLDPGLFGTSWFQFSNRYAVKGNPHVPQMITGYKNQDELQQRMGLITYRCKAADVLDLPETMHEERTCELCAAARNAYRQLEEELITQVGAGVVTASNCLVKLLRLQQLSSGYLIEDDTDKLHRLDTGKQDLLAELLEDAAGEPIVVFCRFRPDLAAVRGACESLGLRYGELSGESKDGLTATAEMSPDIDVLGAQIQSGGVGVDLQRARIAVYFSLGFSLSDYEQSLARLHRPGQKRNVVYYHLIAENTVDRRVYAALRSRKDVIEAVLKGLSHVDES